MKSTITIMASMLLANTLELAAAFTCNGNTEPNWDDCHAVGDPFFAQTGDFTVDNTNGQCYFVQSTNGANPDTVNCVISICPSETGTFNLTYDTFDPPWVEMSDDCQSAGGGGSVNIVTDNIGTITLNAAANPQYKPSQKREAFPPLERPTSLSASRLFPKRGATCTDGSGTMKLFEEDDNVEDTSNSVAITGKLPAGSTYTIMQSDTHSVGVSVDVSVEAGFFDLFSTTIGTTVSEDTSYSSTTGVTINIDCDSGMEGIIYFNPVVTKYDMICTSDNTEIIVLVPIKTQSDYSVTCLGGSD